MEVAFKQYYLERLQWIFRYTSKNFFYCLGKTMCLIVGVPIYAVMFAVEMVLTFVNMIFCWIPVLGIVVGVVCKAIIYVVDKAFYICILTDIPKWVQAHKQEVTYDVADAESDTVEQEGSADDETRPSDGSNDE